jgi:ABC-type polysaccharide/polyol phosphate export permease
VPFIDLFREPLYNASLPAGIVIFHAAALSFAAMLIGMLVFLRQEKKIVFRL